MLRTDLGERVEALVSQEPTRVPAHFDAEVLSTLRRQVRRGDLEPARARLALQDTALLSAERHEIVTLLDEAFGLRDRLAPFDALYAVLARVSGARLLTTDGRLARAAEGYVAIELIEPQ